MKVYTNDPSVPYKTTKVNSQRSKSEIDAVLALWGIKDTGWRWDPEDKINPEIFISFQLREIINGREVTPIVKVSCPAIWNKGNSRRRGEVNWNVSMRVMYWYIKTHLEMAHLMQSSKTVEFLPYIQTRMVDGESVLLKDRLVEIDVLKVLPMKIDDSKVIEVQ